MKAGPSATLVSIEPPWAQMTVSLTASPPSLPTSTLHRVSPPSSLAGRPSCFIWRAIGAACGAEPPKKIARGRPALGVGRGGQKFGGEAQLLHLARHRRGLRRVAAKKDRLRLPGLEAGQDGQEVGGLVGG